MIRPLRDLVYCKRHESEDRIGSILIPQQARKKATRCDVVAVGDQCTELKPGNVVHVNVWEGLEQEIEGEKVFVIHEDEVHAVEL